MEKELKIGDVLSNGFKIGFKNIILLLTIFYSFFLVLGCNNNTNPDKPGNNGALKKLPSIACKYSSQLEEIEKQNSSLEEDATKGKLDEKKLASLMAKSQELTNKSEEISEKGRKELNDYINTTDFHLPAETMEGELLKIKDVRVESAVINPPDKILVNIKIDVIFNKNLKIGYKGDMKQLKILADFLDKNDNIIKTERFYQGMGKIGQDIKKDKIITLHGNPELKKMGKLRKLKLRVEK